MLPGIEVDLGGTIYVVPPLSLASLETLEERLTSFTGGMDAASVRTVIDATHAALKRNYPHLTRDEVAEKIDLANMAEVMEAVMDVAGLKRKAIDTAKKAMAASDCPGPSSTAT